MLHTQQHCPSYNNTKLMFVCTEKIWQRTNAGRIHITKSKLQDYSSKTIFFCSLFFKIKFNFYERFIKRTPSISTTDIVSRLLGFSKTPTIPVEETSKKLQEQVSEYMEFQTHPKNIHEFRVKAAKVKDHFQNELFFSDFKTISFHKARGPNSTCCWQFRYVPY